jgi:hypothetical protein
MPLVSRSILITSAYAPLFALLGLVSWHDHSELALAFYGLAVALITALGLLMLVLSHLLGRWSQQVGTVQSKTEEIGAYAATYLLPFLALTFERWQNVLALFLFISLLAFIYVRARFPYLNPLLLFFGYRLIEIEHRAHPAKPDDPYQTSIAIARRGVANSEVIEASYLQRPENVIGVLLVRGK